jgi:hypothetical protein
VCGPTSAGLYWRFHHHIVVRILIKILTTMLWWISNTMSVSFRTFSTRYTSRQRFLWKEQTDLLLDSRIFHPIQYYVPYSTTPNKVILGKYQILFIVRYPFGRLLVQRKSISHLS